MPGMMMHQRLMTQRSARQAKNNGL
uniref:Uncharacterized protein n=1 Tax=Pyricularia oryzae (strain 70-15 / ATCC MYA-4617 / FGSC 8958) TaxID=242507 RepID=Q2KG95_PYRO7|nr:hypothetical protein MGCH7_ch7g440 [Pyricularia oryzae 70-15]